MSMLAWLTPEIAGNVLIAVSALLALAFVVLYATFFRWRASEIGRNVMTLMASLAVLLTLALIRITAGDTTWFAWLRVTVFAVLPIAIGWRVRMLVRILTAHRRLRAEDTDPVPSSERRP